MARGLPEAPRTWYLPMAVTHPSEPLPEPGRYVRAPRPLVFPVEAKVPETSLHQDRRLLLRELVREVLGASSLIASDQFLYWDRSDPRACSAPDLMVKTGTPLEPVDSWKVWERGAPELCAEIVSRSDASDAAWEAKLERYKKIGVNELVRFDPENAERPLRIWEGFDGDLVERAPEAPGFSRSQTLGLYLVVVSDALLGPALRLSRDAEGRDLIESIRERADREAGTRKAEAEARKAEAEARERAEARVRELEAELDKRSAPQRS